MNRPRIIQQYLYEDSLRQWEELLTEEERNETMPNTLDFRKFDDRVEVWGTEEDLGWQLLGTIEDDHFYSATDEPEDDDFDVIVSGMNLTELREIVSYMEKMP